MNRTNESNNSEKTILARTRKRLNVLKSLRDVINFFRFELSMRPSLFEFLCSCHVIDTRMLPL